MKPFTLPKDLPRTPRDVHTPKTNVSQNDSFRMFNINTENLLGNHLVKKLSRYVDQPALSSRSNTRDISQILMTSPKNNPVQLPKITKEFKLDSNTKYFIKQNFDHFPTKKDKYSTVNASVPEKTSAFTFRPLTKNFKYLFPGASHQRSTEKLILGPIVLSPTSPRGNKIRHLSVKDFKEPSFGTQSEAQKKSTVKFSGVRFADAPEEVVHSDQVKAPAARVEKANDTLATPRRSYMKKATLIRPKIKMKSNPAPMIHSDPSFDDMEDRRYNLEMIDESGEWGVRTHGMPTENDF